MPNLLTVMRMALVPVFIVFYYLGEGADGAGFKALALVVFVAAALTDVVDGHMARKYDLTTNFGKLMDPLADKILTASAFVCFVDTGVVPAWIVVVILAREFLITGLRSVAASEGVVIAAGFSGKLKAVLQMGTIALFLLAEALTHVASFAGMAAVFTVSEVCLWAALAATVYSGAEYLWKCRKLLNMK
ncbi:MAG: CDP-diacylglycerol--glycerol-3-phosphate 3-phosphatidyltransferase [Clostridiales Family XIII bacterium]|nr:CDP-diacylglycerol--glycerol-3-phosphate 3-phosphatidyltransferase [Clostridiales Family XIII bacterium]